MTSTAPRALRTHAPVRSLSKDTSGTIQMEWLSEQHTNQLIPFFVRGAGSPHRPQPG